MNNREKLREAGCLDPDIWAKAFMEKIAEADLHEVSLWFSEGLLCGFIRGQQSPRYASLQQSRLPKNNETSCSLPPSSAGA